jgi:chromosome segregation ATPase
LSASNAETNRELEAAQGEVAAQAAKVRALEADKDKLSQEVAARKKDIAAVKKEIEETQVKAEEERKSLTAQITALNIEKQAEQERQLEKKGKWQNKKKASKLAAENLEKALQQEGEEKARLQEEAKKLVQEKEAQVAAQEEQARRLHEEKEELVKELEKEKRAREVDQEEKARQEVKQETQIRTQQEEVTKYRRTVTQLERQVQDGDQKLGEMQAALEIFSTAATTGARTAPTVLGGHIQRIEILMAEMRARQEDSKWRADFERQLDLIALKPGASVSRAKKRGQGSQGGEIENEARFHDLEQQLDALRAALDHAQRQQQKISRDEQKLRDKFLEISRKLTYTVTEKDQLARLTQELANKEAERREKEPEWRALVEQLNHIQEVYSEIRDSAMRGGQLAEKAAATLAQIQAVKGQLEEALQRGKKYKDMFKERAASADELAERFREEVEAADQRTEEALKTIAQLKMDVVSLSRKLGQPLSDDSSGANPPPSESRRRQPRMGPGAEHPRRVIRQGAQGH